MENTANTSDREIKISRLLHAPIELVWKVWTQPEHIANWWGPNGFTNTISIMDVKEGGEWKLVMHGPDGKNYPNRSIFKEVVLHKKIVYQHFNPNFTATAEFEVQGEKTLLNWQMVFDNRDEFIAVVKQHNAAEGMKQNVEKLETYLANQ